VKSCERESCPRRILSPERARPRAQQRSGWFGVRIFDPERADVPWCARGQARSGERQPDLGGFSPHLEVQRFNHP
jgi:hypothetical protein